MNEAQLQVLSTKCLSYGYAPASNVKQDVAWALTHIVIDIFDAEEAVRFVYETDPDRRAYIAARAAVSERTGRNKLRLFAARIYTDDGRFAVVGVDRAVRLLAVWRRVTLEFGLIMAHPRKRSIGGDWLGVGHTASGVSLVPQRKRLRIIHDITATLESGRAVFTNWRALIG
mmetsp:Transcript_11286/g.37684  ORF Transcript_11286/g.37684 Transcript_11286/m.37684 type:complete len:172 (+) Transcript_11286:85-600(+)